MAIDRSEVSVFVGPFIPDRHSVVLQVLDIRIPGDEPEKFIDDGFQVDFLCRQEGKSFRQVETHLVSENALGADAGTVGFHDAVFADMTKQVEVLFHTEWFSGSGRPR